MWAPEMKASVQSNRVEGLGFTGEVNEREADLRGRMEDKSSEFEGVQSEMSVRYLSGDDQQAAGYPIQERNLGQEYK